MIKENSKIYLKDSSIFNDSVKVGTEFTVVEITKNNIKFESNFGFGIMGMNEFEDYFSEKKIPIPIEPWSEWEYLYEYSCLNYSIYVKTKKNKTHVILRMFDGRISSGRSYTHPDDIYDYDTGVIMAISKALKHLVEGKIQLESDVLKDNPKIRKVWIK